jgi:hypothetical protein
MYVFGYGSLMALPGAVPARLRGYRRVWGVAMDNRVAIPGYKVYELPDGTRPPVSVAFLDLREGDDIVIDGALIAVDDARLAELDGRERQYERIDVTTEIEGAPLGTVWSYVGRAEGRARVAAGRAGRSMVVVQRDYVERVERAFGAQGPDVLARYRATTELPPPFPALELARVDLAVA